MRAEQGISSVQQILIRHSREGGNPVVLSNMPLALSRFAGGIRLAGFPPARE